MSDIHNEAGVKREVRKLLAKHGWFVWMPPANGYGKAGISDFHALRDGKFLAIETKYGGNTTTALQAKFLDNIGLAGGWAIVVNETEHSLKHLEDLLAGI
jgi:Holliday junction resolvase